MQKKSEEEHIFGNSLKKMVEWKVKNDYLKDQITVLEKTKNYPIFAISGFLLKTQLIEFELKQLISNLDLHMYFSNTSQVLKKKTRSPKYLDEKRLTLGKLKDEIEKFDGKFLDNLKKDLSSLITLRNEFVHKLFNLGSLEDMIANGEKGLIAANKTMKSIDEVNAFLKDHDPIKF